MLKIALLDNRELFRVSLKSLLETFENCHVVISTSSLNKVSKTDKDIDLIIVDPYAISGAAKFWLEELKLNHLKSKIVVLTSHLDVDSITTSIEKGVYAYFSKNDCPSELKEIVYGIKNLVYRDKTFFSEEVKRFLVKSSKTNVESFSNLTERELEILRLICEEKANVEISQILNVSVRTIESHRRRMIEKTESKSIIGVILAALRSKQAAYKVLWETKCMKQFNLYGKAQ